jgi:hypothetical protein
MRTSRVFLKKKGKKKEKKSCKRKKKTRLMAGTTVRYYWELNPSSVERTGSNDYLARRATNAGEKNREKERKTCAWVR